jgi:hypothetical protein
MAYRGCRGTDLLLTSEQVGHGLATRSGRFISNVVSISRKAGGPQRQSGYAIEHKSICPCRDTTPGQFYQTIPAWRFQPDKSSRPK